MYDCCNQTLSTCSAYLCKWNYKLKDEICNVILVPHTDLCADTRRQRWKEQCNHCTQFLHCAQCALWIFMCFFVHIHATYISFHVQYNTMYSIHTLWYIKLAICFNDIASLDRIETYKFSGHHQKGINSLQHMYAED